MSEAGPDRPGRSAGPRRVGRLLVGMLLALGVGMLVRHPAAGLGQSPTAATLPADVAGRLLYTRDGGLWTLRLADAQATQIVSPPELGMVTSARWSPDGSRIAYGFYRVEDRRVPMSEVWVAAADGTSGVRVLASEEGGDFYQYPVWGPGGRELYALHTRQTASQFVLRVERVNVATGGRDTAIDVPGEFDVSPDGRWLAVTRSQAGTVSILLLDLNTRQQRELVPPRRFDVISGLRFDPASRTLAFAAGREDGSLSEAAPELGRRLASLLRPAAVSAAHGPPQSLYAAPVSGDAPSLVAQLDADEPVAAWSPDGTHLAVLSVESLSILPTAGGPAATVMAPGAYGSVDWAP